MDPQKSEQKQLEQSIYQDLENLDAWAVYGDWLQEHGDVRGEVIALELARDRLPEAERQAAPGQSRLKALYKKNQENWASDIARLGDICPRQIWAYGYLKEIMLVAGEDEPKKELQYLPYIFQPLVLRFIQNVTVHLDYNPEATRVILEGLRKCTPLQALHTIHFRCELGMGGYLVDPNILMEANPALSRLSLDINTAALVPELQPALHTGLKQLNIRQEYLRAPIVQYLAHSSFPVLESLTLECALLRTVSASRPPWNAIQELFQTRNCPNVKDLTLQSSADHHLNEFPAHITGSPLLRQLQILSFTGPLDDSGAKAILKDYQSYAHLKTLCFTGQRFSPKMTKKLNKQFQKMLTNLIL